MALASMSVHPSIKAKLGDQVLADVARNVWPQDCQSCNRPLGTEPPSLCVDVDELTNVTMATLHHTACQASSWNDSPILRLSNNLSWRSHLINWPIESGDDGPVIWPTLLVNPHLEGVQLRQDTFGAWKVATLDHAHEAGLRVAGPDFVIDRPLPARAGHTPATHLNGATVTVRLSPFEQWGGTFFHQDQTARVRELGGVMFGYTTAVNPPDIATYEDFVQPVVQRQIAFGFVSLAR
ncbi:hypothetical protein [Kitasatospora sp. NPDC001132]